MKDFRDQHPTPDSLDDVGVRRLNAAIILQTAQDYYESANLYFLYQKYPSKMWEYLGGLLDIEQFIHSSFWNSITDISPDHFRNTLLNWRKRGKDISSFIWKWRLQRSHEEEIEQEYYYEPSYLRNLLSDPCFSTNYIYQKGNDKYAKFH